MQGAFLGYAREGRYAEKCREHFQGMPREGRYAEKCREHF